jgi:hypothetical protein
VAALSHFRRPLAFATSSMIQAAHVAPAASRCHAVCFVLPLRSGRVECGRAGRRRARQGSTPPSRHVSRALRSRATSRDRRRVPRPSAAPGRVPGTPQPPPKHRPARCARPSGGSARPLALLARRLRSLRSLRPGPQDPALAVSAGAPARVRPCRLPYVAQIPARRLQAVRHQRSEGKRQGLTLPELTSLPRSLP